MSPYSSTASVDVVLIGGGIMSANLGALLKQLQPGLRIHLFEANQDMAAESSNGWNNAGTGHAGICELSYTPTQNAKGSVDVTKAIEIFEQFEHSKQFWAYAVANGLLRNPRSFINALPHLSFVHGEAQVDFLKARHAALSAHHFFSSMELSTDHGCIGSWAPLLTKSRDPNQSIAATRMLNGTDVNFGEIAQQLVGWLGQQDGCMAVSGQRVTDLEPTSTGWIVKVRHNLTKAIRQIEAKFVFIGAGGGSLPLIQKAGIAEARGLGGFPIGGQWLVCDNPDVIALHSAKVYGQALDTAPTMAVPHLDARVLNGQRRLLFGPFAAWTTRFLHKGGSRWDLFRSIRTDNVGTLFRIGIKNIPLVRYLVSEGTQSMADRLALLKLFYPAARAADWSLIDAGIRVQAIKKTDGQAGIVHYGTEVITDASRTVSALLGASPGASVSVSIVMEVIKRCFPHLLETPYAKTKLKEMIPTWNEDLKKLEAAPRYCEVTRKTDALLQLDRNYV